MTKMKKACHCKFFNKLSILSKIYLRRLVKWMKEGKVTLTIYVLYIN